MNGRCKKCGYKFSYKEKFHCILKGKVNCTNCDAKNIPKSEYKFLLGVFISVPIFIRLFKVKLMINSFELGLINIIYLIVIIFIAPMLIKFDKR